MENTTTASTTTQTSEFLSFIRFENYSDINNALKSKLLCNNLNTEKTNNFSMDCWFHPKNKDYELISTDNFKISLINNLYNIAIGEENFEIEEQDNYRANVQLDKWNNLFITYDGTNLYIYSNLNLIKTISTTLVRLSSNITLGEGFHGSIKALRIYNKNILKDDLKKYVFNKVLTNDIQNDILHWITTTTNFENVIITDLKDTNILLTAQGLCTPSVAVYGVRGFGNDAVVSMDNAVDLGIAMKNGQKIPGTVYIKFFNIRNTDGEQTIFSMGASNSDSNSNRFEIKLVNNESSSVLKINGEEVPNVTIDYFKWNHLVVFLNLEARYNPVGSNIILNGIALADGKKSYLYDGTGLGYGRINIGNSIEKNNAFFSGIISCVALYEDGLVGTRMLELHENEPGAYDDGIRALYDFGMKAELIHDSGLINSINYSDSGPNSFRCLQSELGIIYGLSKAYLPTKAQKTVKTQSSSTRYLDLDELYAKQIENIIIEIYNAAGIAAGISEFSTSNNDIIFEKKLLKEIESNSSAGKKIRSITPENSEIRLVFATEETQSVAKSLKRKQMKESLKPSKLVFDIEIISIVLEIAIIVYVAAKIIKYMLKDILWDATRDIDKPEDQIRVEYKKIDMHSKPIKWFDSESNKAKHSSDPIAWQATGEKEPQLFSYNDYSKDNIMEISLYFRLLPPLSVSSGSVSLGVSKIEVTMEAVDSAGAIVGTFKGTWSEGTSKYPLPSNDCYVTLRGDVNSLSDDLYQFATEYKITAKITETKGVYYSNSLLVKLEIYTLPRTPSLPLHFGQKDSRAINQRKTLPYNNPEYYIDASLMSLLAQKRHPNKDPVFEQLDNPPVKIIDDNTRQRIIAEKNKITLNPKLKYDGDVAKKQDRYFQIKELFRKNLILFNYGRFIQDIDNANDNHRVAVDCNMCTALLSADLFILGIGLAKGFVSIHKENANRYNEPFYMKTPVTIVGNQKIQTIDSTIKFGSHTVLLVADNEGKTGAIFDPTCKWDPDYKSYDFPLLTYCGEDYVSFAIADFCQNGIWKYTLSGCFEGVIINDQ